MLSELIHQQVILNGNGVPSNLAWRYSVTRKKASSEEQKRLILDQTWRSRPG